MEGDAQNPGIMNEEVASCSWVWSWGAGTHGQLASADFSDRLKPLRLASFLQEDVMYPPDSGVPPAILTVAGGGAHAVALVGSEEDAQVLTWGNGESGPLGHGDQLSHCVPKIVKHFQKIRICSVSAGWNHSAFVTSSGDLYTCGAGSFGQLGHGDSEARFTPAHVKSLSGEPVLMAACGMRHTLVLQGASEGHTVYAFGSSKRGQLGIGILQSRQQNQIGAPLPSKILYPQRVMGLQKERIVKVTANGDHSAALTEAGRLYLWGRGFNNMPDFPVPAHVCCELSFADVALGWNHCIALADGQLWAWGSNDRGQLGTLSDSKSGSSSSFGSSFRALDASGSEMKTRKDELSCEMAGELHVHLMCNGNPSSSDVGYIAESSVPKKYHMKIFSVTGFERNTVKSLSAGAEHSAVVLEDGSIMTWGWGEHGQLGLGDDADQPYPRSVPFPSIRNKRAFTWRTFCGSGFTFAVAEEFAIIGKGS